MNWRDFWNEDTPIYVNERHKVLHYSRLARDVASLIPSSDATVLDYGCGEALSADRVAARCAKLYLCDAAANVRERLRARFAGEARIVVLSPEEAETLPEAALDMIVANSVIQYLSLDELRSFLALARAKLKAGGVLVLADVVPPQVGPLTDARALLSFAWKGGFLGAGIVGLVRTAASEYRKLREEIGLSQYAEPDIVDILAEAGFAAERLPHNIGHNQARLAFRARRLA
jgi:cyclopropane fatty-acyl-phospholipid synthase-like methyltransferase